MSTRHALFYSFLDRYAALLLAIGSSMVIARLLTPNDLGVFSVTMVFIALISSIRDLGAGQYLVQEYELTPAKINATWTVLLGMGLLLAVLVLLLAYPVAWAYQEPRMVAIMQVIALNFAINPLGSLSYAWLMRELRFDALAVMRFSGSLVGALVAIYLAWRGHGPISLAWGSFSTTLVNAAVALRYRPPEMRWMPEVKELRRVVGFGSSVSATSLITSLTSGAPEMLLGKLQSLTAAGLFSRGNGLPAMFQKLVLDATQAVALPMLAKAQRDKGCIDEPLLRAMAYITVLGWSFFLGLIALGFPVTRLLYGDQWDESVTLMRLLTLGMSVLLPAVLCPTALLALGQARVVLRVTLILAIVHVALIGLGACFSLNGAGLGFIAAQLFAAPLWLRSCRRETQLGWRQLLGMLARSAGVAALTGLVPLACALAFGLRPVSPWPPILLSLLIGPWVFLAAAHGLRHPILDEIHRLLPRLKSSRNR